MAGLSWLRTGTIAVINGGKAVTGTDTIWGGGVVNPGDIIMLPNGTLGEVESISSNTALVLKQAYTGATASAQPYAIIRMLPSGNVAADLAAALQALIQRFGITLDQLVDLFDGTGTAMSFSDGTTTLSGLPGLRGLAGLASESAAGRVKLASAAAAVAGTDATSAVTPAGLRSALASPIAGQADRYDEYQVAAGAYVPLILPGGSTALSAGTIYRVTLVTQSTGTQTGAVYLIHAVAGAWTIATVASNGLFSNHPQLRLNGGVVEVFHAHTSPYAITARVRSTVVGNITGVARTVFGLDGAMSNSQGRVLVGAASDDGVSALQCAGVVAADAMRVKSYTRATVPAAAASARSMIYVSDAVGGASFAWSDGASWTSFKTNAAI